MFNKGSASASGIYGGALKDNKRAVIVGDNLFCKCLVRNRLDCCRTNSVYNITIQKYLTPSGTDIHTKRYFSDIVVELTEDDIKNKDDKAT